LKTDEKFWQENAQKFVFKPNKQQIEFGKYQNKLELSHLVLTLECIPNRDVNESQKNSRRKTFFNEKFLDPKFVLEQMWALNRLRTEMRCLCSLLLVDARRFSSRLPWPSVTLLVSDYSSRPAPTSSVAVCLPDAIDLTATASLPLR